MSVVEALKRILTERSVCSSHACLNSPTGHLPGCRYSQAVASIAEAEKPQSITDRLLFLAREMKDLDNISLVLRNEDGDRMQDIIGDILAQEYDRAIAKLTGIFEPPDGDPREGEICDHN